MRILGISAYYHDSAAAIIEDGRVVEHVRRHAPRPRAAPRREREEADEAEQEAPLELLQVSSTESF